MRASDAIQATRRGIDGLRALAIKAIRRVGLLTRDEGPDIYFYAAITFASMALVIGLGPTLQNYISLLISSSEANIYDTAYKKAIQVFPTLSDWLLYSLDPAILVASLSVTVFGLSSTQPRTVLVRSAAAAFVTLSALDVAILMSWDAFTLENISTSIASNFVGGFVIGLVLVGLRRAAAFVLHYEEQSGAIIRITAMTTPLVLAFSISCIVYFAASTVYEASPASFKATVEPKSWGVYRGDYKPDKGSSEPKVFGFFNERHYLDHKLNWLGMSTPLIMKWHASETDARHNIEIRLHNGCRQTKLDALLKSKATFRVANATDMSATVDKGLAEYEVIQIPHSGGYFRASNEQVNTFRIEREGKSKELKFVLFVGPEVKVDYWRPGEPMSIYLSAFLLQQTKPEAVQPAPRTMQFSVNGERTKVTFRPNESQGGSSRIRCSPALLRKVRSNEFEVSSSAPFAGALITFTPASTNMSYEHARQNEVAISGANGWLGYSNERHTDEEGEFSKGVSDFVVVSGKFKSFSASNAAFASGEIDSVQAFGGETEMTLDKNGALVLTGEAKALYWNHERVNKTRWEKMDLAERSILLTWIAGLLFLCYRAFRSILGQNHSLGFRLRRK